MNDIGVDDDDAAIVRAIIGLGHDLGLKIVAEGVSSAVQLDFLRAEGCDSVQGFLMSPAVHADAFADLMRESARGTVEPEPAMQPRRSARIG